MNNTRNASAPQAPVPSPPTLRSTAMPPANAKAVSTRSATSQSARQDPMRSSQLRWSGATLEQVTFMRNVYDRQVSRAATIRPFLSDIPAQQLAIIEGTFVARTAPAAACASLLAAARKQLAQEQRQRSAHALSVGSIALSEAYRAASEQWADWERAFPRYYDDTSVLRSGLPGGCHGDAAVRMLARYVSARQEPPGFSRHNTGTAIDFRTSEGDATLEYAPSTAGYASWQQSWFFQWLQVNAQRYLFSLGDDSQEPWHWEYQGTMLAKESVDVDRASQLNQYYADQLGWSTQFDQIVTLLGLDASPTDTTFAQAVASWQADQGLNPDGIIGPTTWARMQAKLIQVPTPQSGRQPSVPMLQPTTEPPLDQQIAWGARVSPEFKSKVIDITNDIGTSPDYLMAAMAFETGETFSPSKENAVGSGAVGLIQFMPRTAKRLGTTTDALKGMTAEEQLDYVHEYFAPYRGRVQNLEDLYMAILWPTGIGKPADSVLFASPSKEYDQNKGLDADGDGRVTKTEAVARVRAKLNKGLQPQNMG